MSEVPLPGHETLSLDRTQPRDELCDRFEAAWKAASAAGSRPRIQDFLNAAPEPERLALLRKLIGLDIHCRRRQGEDPRAEEYQAHFPALDPVWLASQLVTPPAGGPDFPPTLRTPVSKEPAQAQLSRAPRKQRIRCPHCHNPIVLAEEQPVAVRCPGCGSSFRVCDAQRTFPSGEMRLLGKFQLLEQVGVGAFGAVWRARDTELDRIVALKIPHTGLSAAPADLERFHREARAAAQLRHPGIVTVHEVMTLEGLPVIVSDFIDGVTLRDLLQTRPLTAREAANLVAEAAEAVDYAHAMGLVHRDIKPANIMIESSRPETGQVSSVGRPLIMDFGLALREDAEITLTLDGQVVGTPAYMSPEQAAGHGHRVDRRSDVYSLGVVLYQLLCGELPFRGSKTMLLEQVRHEEPRPPRRITDKVPRDLETICLKALAKEPTRRYPTARALAEDLRRWLNGQAIEARPVGRGEHLWRWCRRNPALAGASGLAGAALVAVTAVSIFFALYKTAALAESEKDRRQLAQFARLSASLTLDQGLARCERGHAAEGMLWLARSLEMVPDDAVDLQRAIRANLADWRRSLHGVQMAVSHRDTVYAVAFSPDGRTFVTGSGDHTAQLWSAVTGQQIGAPLKHHDVVTSVAFSRDGQLVLTGSEDKTVRLWNAATGQPVGQPLTAKDKIRAVALSPDGKTVLTGGEDKTAQLWDAATGQPLGGSFKHEGIVRAVAFSPDGQLLLTGSGDGKARLWKMAARETPVLVLPHRGGVTAVAFSPDGKTILTGTGASAESGGPSGRTAQTWNAATGKPSGLVLEHENWVAAVTFSADGKTILTGSGDRTARLWDAATGQPIGLPLWHQDQVWAVAFRPDGQTVLTGGGDNTARIWEVTRDKPRGENFPHPSAVSAAAFSPDGKTVLTASRDKKARLWEIATGKSIPLPHKGHILALTFSPDGRIVATGGEGKTAQLWDAATGRPIGGPLPHEGAVTAVAFSPDNKLVATGSQDQKVRLWDVATGRPLGQPLAHAYPVHALCFSRDGRMILTASGRSGVYSKGEARLWDPGAGQPIGQPLYHRGDVLAVAFSPDARTVLTGGWQRAQLWETTTGQPLGPPLRHNRYVRGVAFSPDGKTILTWGDDNLALLWDAATGQPLGQPLQHDELVRAAAFSPDGKTVLTGSDDQTARLWDAVTSKPLGRALRHQNDVMTVAFGPDSQTALTGSRDRTARLWVVPAALEGTVERIVLWTQVLTGMELDADGVLQVLDASTWQQRAQHLQELGGPPIP
jgi:WD40 repeat protein